MHGRREREGEGGKEGESRRGMEGGGEREGDRKVGGKRTHLYFHRMSWLSEKPCEEMSSL